MKKYQIQQNSKFYKIIFNLYNVVQTQKKLVIYGKETRTKKITRKTIRNSVNMFIDYLFRAALWKNCAGEIEEFFSVSICHICMPYKKDKSFKKIKIKLLSLKLIQICISQEKTRYENLQILIKF